ncbi:MAG: hypothetical protein GY870_22525, partial [archaeon]|nr:hypothetical protein [archaeon]
MTQNKLENENISVTIENSRETIEIIDNNKKIPILGNFDGLNTLTFFNKNTTRSLDLSFESKSENKLIYSLMRKAISIKLEITIEDSNSIHYEYDITFNKKFRYSKILANYAILQGKDPEYTWVPHIRNRKDFVIADHVFRSPVVLYKKGEYSFALIPDL